MSHDQREQEKAVARDVISIVHFIANELHNQLKAEGKRGLVSNTHYPNHLQWIQVSAEVKQFRLKRILDILSISKRIFSEEQRVVKVTGPCLVFGDLHGNLSDVLYYEKLFWSRTPSLVEDSFVFLGDYVDRGLQSLEVYLYMIAMKVLIPDKFTVLRGNHETRQMQEQFSFFKECIAKFGQQEGIHVWNVVNETMDCMAFCAVINDSIFAAHGGIPTSESLISSLNQIPNQLSDPELQGPSAWEVMWNDPASNQDMEEARGSLGNLTQRQQPTTRFNGFIPNVKRGTAFLFNEFAVDEFLAKNNLTHVIRAHEMRKQGFSLHFNAKVATVFSCSFYSGQRNIAAVIRVQDAKIIPIQIQTMKKEE